MGAAAEGDGKPGLGQGGTRHASCQLDLQDLSRIRPPRAFSTAAPGQRLRHLLVDRGGLLRFESQPCGIFSVFPVFPPASLPLPVLPGPFHTQQPELFQNLSQSLSLRCPKPTDLSRCR